MTENETSTNQNRFTSGIPKKSLIHNLYLLLLARGECLLVSRIKTNSTRRKEGLSLSILVQSVGWAPLPVTTSSTTRRTTKETKEEDEKKEEEED